MEEFKSTPLEDYVRAIMVTENPAEGIWSVKGDNLFYQPEQFWGFSEEGLPGHSHHLEQFGLGDTAADLAKYDELARKFASSKVEQSEFLFSIRHITINNKGEKITNEVLFKYNPETNTLGEYLPDGQTITMFKPKKGKQYLFDIMYYKSWGETPPPPEYAPVQ